MSPFSRKIRNETTGHQVLDTQLQKQAHLNLTGKVKQITHCGIETGPLSIVLRANLKMTDGTTSVAVKRVPAHLRMNEKLAKVITSASSSYRF